MSACIHGQEIGQQGGIALQDIAACESEADEMWLLEFYSACDCCDTLMHHNACGFGYVVLDDGRTLCLACSAATPGSEGA